jgi:hypothetical protein
LNSTTPTGCESASLCDAQRSPSDLKSHRHFIVLDGDRRAVDVVARSVSLKAVEGQLDFHPFKALRGFE